MITLLEASAIVDASLQYARAEALAPMTVAVLDARGCTVCLKLEDGSALLRPEIACGKAWSALGMGFGTRNLAFRAAKLPSFFGALAALADGRVLPVPGGVLIRSRDGQIVGAAGASGDVADQDEACVVAGITTAGYTPDPGTAELS
jgi:uncharacterized protein GlcG (DUF336 family)